VRVRDEVFLDADEQPAGIGVRRLDDERDVACFLECGHVINLRVSAGKFMVVFGASA
jgi:hypothetical protein